MVSKTKNKRYTEREVKALLENYTELKQSPPEDNPTYTHPLIDFELAVKRIKLTKTENAVLTTKYFSDDRTVQHSIVADRVGVSTRAVEHAVRRIKDVLLAEMNRGIADD